MADARVTLEDLTPVRKRLQIEVPAAAVQAELERAFQRVGQQARLRGFRPGKAPRTVIERTFGAEVRREVLGRLVEQTFHEAIDAHQLAIVGMPDIDAEALTPGEALRYSATVDVRPVITLGDLDELSVVRPATAVTDDDVERVVNALRESVAQLRPVEDRATVEAGDVVTADITTRREGAEPATRAGVLLEAGAGAFPLALERQLVGQHRGAQLSLKVPYPADYANAGLAGQTVDFELEIKELRTKELPALDDEFARDHGRCDTLVELRARIRADLEREATERADDAVREGVLEQLLARHAFEVPPSLVDRRTEAIAASFEARLPRGPERERALEELRNRLRPGAERQVRAELLLDAIATQDDVEVSEDDVRSEIEAIATREREVVERVRALYERPETRAALRAKMIRDRALARLVARARIMPQSAAESVAHEK
jgi:trigger factor